MVAQLDDIIIDIEVRLNELEVQMRQAESIVDGSVERIDRSVASAAAGGIFLFAGNLRAAFIRSTVAIAGIVAGIEAANIAMDNLSSTSKLFSGDLDIALVGVLELGEAFEKSFIGKGIFALSRGFNEFILRIRETVEELAGPDVFAGGPLSGTTAGKFFDIALGGAGKARRATLILDEQEKFSKALEKETKERLRHLRLLQTRSRLEEENVKFEQRIERAREEFGEGSDFFKRREELFGEGGDPLALFRILAQTARELRRRALETPEAGRGFQIQAFQTPLGIARFSGGQNALDRIAVATEKTADNTKNSGGAF